ncbi:MAG: BamA/TamA family outer membrane protein [Synergistaceae bacterium]|jgi:outer membrane protein insertion porin family|nr:BamA/TamA family outer membrane protein [Synergistaceae bacterium]
MLFLTAGSSAAEPRVVRVGVRGNEQITSSYILGVVETKPGEELNRDKLQKDIESIYNQGFFSFVDVDLSAAEDGVEVLYSVRENPIVEEIFFTGNTVYSDETLMKEVFTQTGSVFNRVFFRNDLDRIQDKYHKDGYVMVRVADVNIQNGRINVQILEPRVGQVIIQGNKKTKTHVIRREIKLQPGDLFNIIKFRHQLGKLQSLGYFEDVNVGFDNPEGRNDMLDVILTVKEKKTITVGLNVGYGTETGISGGVNVAESNFNGQGYILDLGFDEGDEARYWASFSSPYMDRRTYGWRVGVTYYDYIDQFYYRRSKKQFEYDEKSLSLYAGLGKKFGRREEWSWFFTLNRRDVEYSNVHDAKEDYYDDLTMWGGVNLSGELQFTLDKRDPYLSYSKGWVWDLALEQAVRALGGDYEYLKYWAQLRFYMPLNSILDGVIDTDSMWTEDNPLIFAARVRVGSSTAGNLPAFARYSLGGMNSLRGYHSRTFEGRDILLGNFELRVPVQKNFSLVAFYDVGNAGDNMDWGETYDNYGIGLRVKTPFGQIRLDFATGGDEDRTYFGFGELF